MILDRKQGPEYKKIENIHLQKAEEKKLKNNIPLYVVNAGDQDLIRIEFIFSAGAWNQHFPLVAFAANEMLEEGTKKHTASEIAEIIDFYGAFFETEASQDYAYVRLYTLNKHLKATLPIVEDIIKNAVFPENEFITFIQNRKQNLLVNEQKVDHVARKKFMELLFGEKYPYGHYVTAADYDHLKRDYLIAFHKQFYTSDNCKIIVAGKVNQQSLDAIDNYFGGTDWKSDNKIANQNYSVKSNNNDNKHLVIKKDAVQSAIRVGKILFNKTHPDYLPMLVLNTILGGYFGSRLMANIREDKGYTYGINSSIVSLKNAGYFVIGSEVGVDVCSKAIDEIFLEIKRLREGIIPDSELQLVKNYMLGTFLRGIDGPFALADKFRSIMEYGLSYDYYNNFINTVKNISSNELRELANKYFQQDSMIELVVGNKK